MNSTPPHSRHTCLRCRHELTQAPEKECGDWFRRCLRCGARNIMEPASPDRELVGWAD